MLEIQNIHKSYPGISAVNGVSLTIQPEEILALVGPSGCGKTTLMRMIAGLEQPDQGEIFWNGNPLRDTQIHQRNFGLMFQDYALFPHMTVARNISFGLEMLKVDKAKIADEIDTLLTLVGLPGFADRDVSQLSGGEQQRVALARSLAPKPRLLMLDEPLGALDRALRERLQSDLHKILKEAKQTTLYVTHDQEEAFTLADRVAVMNSGKIIQLGTPQEIYQQPATPFVAEFIGFDNLYAAEPGGSDNQPLAKTAIGNIPLASPMQSAGTLLLRPDRISLDDNKSYKLQGELIKSSFRGSLVHLVVNCDGVKVEIHTPSHDQSFLVGDSITISFDPGDAIQMLNS